MLIAFLQMRSAQHRGLSSADTGLLYPMIHESNNEAASAVLSIVGGAAIARVAREAGMRDYAPGVGWWAYSQTSAVDQARLLSILDRLVPARFYGYVRYLMSTIEPSQSWGIPPVARPRWQVFFKTGALPERGLFNEVARLERGGVTFSVAVLTDGDPSMAYGEQTIAGVAARLLARTHERAVLPRASRCRQARRPARAPPRPRHRRERPDGARRSARPPARAARRDTARAAHARGRSGLPLVPRAAGRERPIPRRSTRPSSSSRSSTTSCGSAPASNRRGRCSAASRWAP